MSDFVEDALSEAWANATEWRDDNSLHHAKRALALLGLEYEDVEKGLIFGSVYLLCRGHFRSAARLREMLFNFAGEEDAHGEGRL